MIIIVKVRELVRGVLALFFYYSGIAFIRACFCRRRGHLVRLLLVHHIKDLRKFERMIRFLATHYQMISLGDLTERKFLRKRVHALLTLDDGYASWLREGLPILEKYQVPALFFISSGLIEAGEASVSAKFLRENLKVPFRSEPLTWEMLRTLAAHPLIEIGGHTRSHPDLTGLSQDRVRQEILEDRKVLEQKTGRRLRAFAYPFGNWNDTVRSMAGEEYPYAMTTESDFYSTNGDSLSIPRSNHGTIGNQFLRMWMLGAFDLAEKVLTYFRSIKARVRTIFVISRSRRSNRTNTKKRR